MRAHAKSVDTRLAFEGSGLGWTVTVGSHVVENLRGTEAGWVTVSIRRVSAGSGYRYLMQSVAAGDGQRAAATPLTRYYAEAGTPPGYWMGAGLAGLDGGRGVAAGSEVTERQLFHLLGQGADPVTGAPLGRAPNQQRSGVGGNPLRP